jgi:acetyltransferase-like isoleucine patch superfamily enzyme
MSFTHIPFQENETESPLKILPNSSFKLFRFSKLIDSRIEGDGELGEFSCINRSQLGRGSHLGVQSYVADATIGRFTMIGSRVSIGGFEHPTSWLSVAAFQWGQSIADYEIDVESALRLQSNSKPEYKRTSIGSDVWIGNNVVVKSGVNIGHGAIVGAGSVVTKDIDPYAIVVGNPARLLKYRFDSEIIQDLLLLKWWNLSYDVLSKLDFKDVQGCIVQLKKEGK